MWIVLEYRGLWAHDAVDHSALSEELKAFLRDERRRVPHTRILFVRSGERRSRDGLVAFLARTSETVADIRRLELDRHDELIGLDLERAGTPVGHPLFLVCTHGKHDRCCAKYGRPLYDAVREQVDEGWVWQSTHVGGDRFAGNLVVLPDGVYHGRVEPANAWAVIEASLAGRVHLPCYRGRSCHGFAAQAAELRVRQETGLLEISAVRVRSIQPAADGWLAEVEAGGTVYDVDVWREEGEATHLTCSAAALRRPSRHVAGSLRVRAS